MLFPFVSWRKFKKKTISRTSVNFSRIMDIMNVLYWNIYIFSSILKNLYIFCILYFALIKDSFYFNMFTKIFFINTYILCILIVYE